jgi:NAD(P)H-flavin reductase/ferredoxin
VAQVRVEPFGADIPCGDGETVLAAVLRSGRYLRYGCKYGGCGTCRSLLVAGDVTDSGSTFALPAAAREQGWILSCTSVPAGDCVIDVSAMSLSDAEFNSGDQVATAETSLVSVSSLTPTIYGVELRLVDPPALAFKAGQFIEVEVPGNATAAARAFSIASSPAAGPGVGNAVIELFVKRLPGGRFGGYLESARPGDKLRVRGPLGSLRVRPSYRKLIMIAGGSGLAPVLSMLTDLAGNADQRAVSLFFGARTVAELYHLERLESLRQQSARLDFVPVVQYADPDWCGETGLVTEAVARRMPSLRGFDAYICGPPPMVAAAIDVVRRLGVREPNVYYDAFVPTGILPGQERRKAG